MKKRLNFIYLMAILMLVSNLSIASNFKGEQNTDLWTYVENIGSTYDYTYMINTALANNYMVSLLPGKTYTIYNKIIVPDDKTFQIPAGTKLIFKASSSSNTAIQLCNGSTLIGQGTLKTDKTTWDYSTSQKTAIVLQSFLYNEQVNNIVFNVKIDLARIESF